MKNSIKKIFSIVMIVAMLMFSLSMVAFATETTPEGNVSTSSAAADTDSSQSDVATSGANGETGIPATASAAPSSATATGDPTKDSTKATASGWQAFLPMILWLGFIVVVGYFLIYRPNKKRKKQEEELRNSLMLGDEVTTIGGIVGKIVNIKDDNITIETSVDKTLMEFKNWAIRDIKKLETDDEPETK